MTQETIRPSQQLKGNGVYYLFYSHTTPGELTTDVTNIFTAPINLTLREVQACGTNTNDGVLRAGTESDPLEYLYAFYIGDGGVPVRKYLASDFVGGEYPVIPSGTTIQFVLGYRGAPASGIAVVDYNLLAIFSATLNE